MSEFQLLRALVRANLTLSLAGDKLRIDGNLRVIELLRAPLQTHKAALRALMLQGRLDAALREAAAYEAMLAESWGDPHWVDVDKLLAHLNRPRLPARVMRRGARR